MAGRVAKAAEAEVYVIQCAEPELDFVSFDADSQVVRDRMAAEFHREHDQVHAVAKGLREEGIKATALLIQGPIVETTLKEAMRLNAEQASGKEVAANQILRH